MTQAELNRAIAQVTGESVDTICRHGFSMHDPSQVDREPLVIDWDEHDKPRTTFFRRRRRKAKSAS